jgi:hypothetical protein
VMHIKIPRLSCSNPGHPFAAGLVLSKLSAVTVDDLGKETFATGGDLDRVKKVHCSYVLHFVSTFSHILLHVCCQHLVVQFCFCYPRVILLFKRYMSKHLWCFFDVSIFRL